MVIVASPLRLSLWRGAGHASARLSDEGFSQLDELEAEGIHVLREAAAQFERPALLFSGGKDSICMVRLAQKAFRPGRFRFRSSTSGAGRSNRSPKVPMRSSRR